MQLRRDTSSTRRFGWVGAVALAMVMPLFDAHAQPPVRPLQANRPLVLAQSDQPQAREKTTNLPTEMNGKSITLSDGDVLKTYLVNKQTEAYPSYSVTGPARVSIEFYPVVDKNWFKTEDTYQRTVVYSISKSGADGKEASYAGNTSLSDFTADGNVIPKKGPLGIGTPIKFTVDLGAGDHTLQFLRPNGFVRIVKAEQVIVPVRQKPQVVPQSVKPVPLPDQVTPVISTQLHVPVADVRYAFTSWNGTGSRMASHQLEAAYRLGYLWLGGSGSFLNHSLNNALPAGDLNATNLSWSVAGRIGFGTGGEHGFWRVAVNIGRISRNLNSSYHTSAAKPNSDSGVLAEGDLTGMVGFGKGGHVYGRVRFGNNPNAPGDAELHISYPLIVPAHPASLHLSAQYFNAFAVSTGAENVHITEGGRLILIHANAMLPLIESGPFALSLPLHGLVPIENFDSGIHPAIGSGLGLNLLLGNWRIAAIGGVALPIGNWAHFEPLVSIGLSYHGYGSSSATYSGPVLNADVRASK